MLEVAPELWLQRVFLNECLDDQLFVFEQLLASARILHLGLVAKVDDSAPAQDAQQGAHLVLLRLTPGLRSFHLTLDITYFLNIFRIKIF